MVRLFALTLLASFLLSPLALSAEADLSIRTYPNGGFLQEGSTIIATTRLTPSPDNRTLVLGISCDSYFRTSQMDVDEKSPISHREEYRNLPAGYCQAFAVLRRVVDGKMKEIRVEGYLIQIIGASASPRF